MTCSSGDPGLTKAPHKWLGVGKRLFRTHGSAGNSKTAANCSRYVLIEHRSRLYFQAHLLTFELHVNMTLRCALSQVSKLKTENFKPKEQVTLEPYERDHAVVIALYRPAKKKSKDT